MPESRLDMSRRFALTEFICTAPTNPARTVPSLSLTRTVSK